MPMIVIFDYFWLFIHIQYIIHIIYTYPTALFFFFQLQYEIWSFFDIFINWLLNFALPTDFFLDYFLGLGPLIIVLGSFNRSYLNLSSLCLSLNTNTCSFIYILFHSGFTNKCICNSNIIFEWEQNIFVYFHFPGCSW